MTQSNARRKFIRNFSVALSAIPLAACGGDDDASYESITYAHGVASGDPLADRVILWTRVSGPTSGRVAVNYAVYADPQLTQAVTDGATETDETRDYTVKIDAAGLQPGTTYYYQFESGGVKSPVGRTRTLPAGGVERVRIGVVSCASYAHGLFNAYARVAARQDLDLVLHLGDYIYEYSSGTGTDAYGDFRQYEPAKEIIDLTDYRQRYAQYRLDADLQALHRQHPMINIWDDHETADNSWRDGAVNHTPDSEGDVRLGRNRAGHEMPLLDVARSAAAARIYRHLPTPLARS